MINYFFKQCTFVSTHAIMAYCGSAGIAVFTPNLHIGMLEWSVSGSGRFTSGEITPYLLYMGTAVAQWLRCCATSRKDAGSFPDGVIGISH
jgi:hypothetical protein